MDRQDNNIKDYIENLTKDHRTVVKSVDGFERPQADEKRLNDLAFGTFSTGAGKEFLNYLRQITLNHPLPPDVSDSALRHKEGMRYLFGIIYTRFEKGKNNDR